MRLENQQSPTLIRVGIKQRFSNLDRNFTPKQTREVFGIEFHPIAAAPSGGSGVFSIHTTLSQHKMLTFLNEEYSLEDLYAFFFEPRDYAVYTMDCTESALHKWNTVKSKLPSGNIKHVFINSEYGNSQQFLDFIKKFKEDNPKVNLFAGQVETVECAERAYHAGADVVVVGNSNSYPHITIQTLDELIDLARIHGRYIAGIHMDFLNGIAAGVDFIISDVFAEYEESGGKVEVRDYGTVKVADGRERILQGSVVKQIEHFASVIHRMMHHVGARDLNNFVQRTIFTHNVI